MPVNFFISNFLLSILIQTHILYSLRAIIIPVSNPAFIPNVSSKGKTPQNHPHFRPQNHSKTYIPDIDILYINYTPITP